jgi:hypothetical protein
MFVNLMMVIRFDYVWFAEVDCPHPKSLSRRRGTSDLAAIYSIILAPFSLREKGWG